MAIRHDADNGAIEALQKLAKMAGFEGRSASLTVTTEGELILEISPYKVVDSIQVISDELPVISSVLKTVTGIFETYVLVLDRLGRSLFKIWK